MSTKARKESKFKSYIKAPGRALIKARDLYVRSLSNCARNVGYVGGATGYSAPSMAPFPRSFSSNSAASSNSEEDFRELIRAASTRSNGNNIDLLKQLQMNGVNVVPRSHTVAIGRIDEDKPYDQFGDHVIEVKPDAYARSRSLAFSKTNRMI